MAQLRPKSESAYGVTPPPNHAKVDHTALARIRLAAQKQSRTGAAPSLRVWMHAWVNVPQAFVPGIWVKGGVLSTQALFSVQNAMQCNRMSPNLGGASIRLGTIEAPHPAVRARSLDNSPGCSKIKVLYQDSGYRMRHWCTVLSLHFDAVALQLLPKQKRSALFAARHVLL